MGNVKIGGTVVSYKKGAGTLVAHRFVGLASATTVVPIAHATTVLPVGVLLAKTARTDLDAPVQIDGIVDVEVGVGDVAAYGSLKMTDTGCVTDAATLASGECFVGNALELGAAGSYIKVKLNPTPFITAT